MTLFALSSNTVLGAGILDPNPGLAFWFLITFILVAVVLRWKVWGPLAQTIEEREKSIQSAIDQAKLEREQAERLLSEQKIAADNARKETAELVRKNQLEVEKAKEQMLAQAQAEADAKLKESLKQIEEEKRKALVEVRETAIELALAAASKLVSKELNDASHRTLAEQFVSEVQSGGAKARLSA